MSAKWDDMAHQIAISSHDGNESEESDEDEITDISPDTVHAQQEWHLRWLREAYRVLKPGGIIKSFSATRTFHRMAAAMEQAGFVDIKMEA